MRLDVPGVVAVVDDDVGIAMALQGWLEMMSVQVRMFHDGPSLLSALQPEPESAWSFRDGGQRLSTVIVDLNLPGMSGFDVARRLLQQSAQLNIVVITAASGESLEMLGGVPPGVLLVGKPFNLFELETWLKPPYV
jgi:two-component system phosphate regulon response regulator OmpR